MNKILIFFINIYQSAISPALGKNCRYIPTCSEYMKEAISVYGAKKGVCMGLKRIMRCHPFHKGGYDPVRVDKKEEE